MIVKVLTLPERMLQWALNKGVSTAESKTLVALVLSKYRKGVANEREKNIGTTNTQIKKIYLFFEINTLAQLILLVEKDLKVVI